ncbi:carboxyvinyl-carboxyphosphonate phosphorylmutase [Caenimonas koreensis DSM 17982]|uniref:Carboxyvinyl-carboxyphosphonate phosphorylmutase n=1 Tax=Caenimonas koreensis DSM 17982 TaxID=1121255 RepID=A0A844AY99_9BURK|nr:isocitrate lyase/PEP mutase family protein [Caenimonas koreensis]MRD49014.1 carboxyvinyl-carboxyphosphonate phosphorylmutase [Caenimonas koreensis DSM 17982]
MTNTPAFGFEAAALRTMMASGRTVWMAGAYDGLSARLISQAGFKAVCTTGYGISGSHLGKPDVEIYTMSENLAVVAAMVEAIRGVPLVTDCDTGYGGIVNIHRTMRQFERAGVAGMIFEDQRSPKHCPCLPGPIDLVSLEEGQAKIRAAVEARLNPDTVIVARSDATTMEECIARLKAYAEAGADVVQPISGCIKSLADIRALKEAVGKLVSLQLLNWLETDLTPADIESVATFATYPLVALMTVTKALQDNLAVLAQTHSSKALPHERVSMDDFKGLIGYEDVVALQGQCI